MSARRLTVAAVVFVALALVQQTAPAEANAASRCYQQRPVCRYGTQPLCLCESKYSIKCRWVCSSPG